MTTDSLIKWSTVLAVAAVALMANIMAGAAFGVLGAVAASNGQVSDG